MLLNMAVKNFMDPSSRSLKKSQCIPPIWSGSSVTVFFLNLLAFPFTFCFEKLRFRGISHPDFSIWFLELFFCTSFCMLLYDEGTFFCFLNPWYLLIAALAIWKYVAYLKFCWNNQCELKWLFENNNNRKLKFEYLRN